MFGFGKRKQTKAKREAIEIGEQVVDRVNKALTLWRTESLESRRTMLDNSFAERIVGLEADGGLSFETVAEIEALALMKNWLEASPEYEAEWVRLIDQDTLDCLGVIGIEDDVHAHIESNIAEVTRDIENDLDIAITEAVERRSETPLRAGSRDIAERCLLDDPFVDSLTVKETLNYLTDLARNAPPAEKIISVVRRLYDLAFFERAVSDEERDLALSIAIETQVDVEAALANEPDSLAAFSEAVAYQKERARHCGVGSLQWKLEEESIPTNGIIAFVAREEHAQLLPAFLEMMEVDVIEKIRSTLLNAMVDACSLSEQSSLEFLTGLALARDQRLVIQLDSDELRILCEAETDPVAAQELVLQLLTATTQ